MKSLATENCKPCSAGTLPLSQQEINQLMKQLDGWKQHDQLIVKTVEFVNYYETIAFVNAVAWISHSEDHHPDLNISYKSCRVEYSTHSINGLSVNDFICATKIDALLTK